MTTQKDAVDTAITSKSWPETIGQSIGNTVWIWTMAQIVMKCHGVIDMSWWWVFAPSLILTGSALAIFLLLAIAVGCSRMKP